MHPTGQFPHGGKHSDTLTAMELITLRAITAPFAQRLVSIDLAPMSRLNSDTDCLIRIGIDF